MEKKYLIVLVQNYWDFLITTGVFFRNSRYRIARISTQLPGLLNNYRGLLWIFRGLLWIYRGLLLGLKPKDLLSTFTDFLLAFVIDF